MIYLSTALPTPAELATNPHAVRGLKVVSAVWTNNDSAVLVRCDNYTGTSKQQWVAYYEVVFERDETNDETAVTVSLPCGQGTCNPFRASCVALFCTFDDMMFHVCHDCPQKDFK